jgi:hypothetical protein
MKMIRFRASNAAGYILLEAILALAVFSGIAAYQVRQQRDDLVERAAKAHGQEMARIADAANRYALENLNQLAQGLDVLNVANDFAPTVQELGTLGLLPAGYGTAPLFGGGYNINIRLEPAGCAVGTCRVRGLLVTTQPIEVTGQRSVSAIGRAIEEIGVDGGVTGLGTLGNNVVEGRGNWQENLPPPPFTAQAGLIGIQLGASETLFNQYLRRDGSLPMLGNLNMLGNGLRNDINNAGQVNTNNLAVNGQVVTDLNMGTRTIDNAGRVNTNNLAVNGQVVTDLNMGNRTIDNANLVNTNNFRVNNEVVSSLNMGGNNVFNATDISANSNISANNNVWANNSAGSPFTYGRDWVWSDGAIYVGLQANEGDGCGPSGALGRRPDGTSLACVSGVWRRNGGVTFSSGFEAPDSQDYNCPSGYVMNGFNCTGRCNSNNMRARCIKIE